MDTGTMPSKKSKSQPSVELERLALLKIVETSPLLTQRGREVWIALYRHGPATGQEIDKRIGAIGCASSRLIELERQNMAKRIGRRHCSVSGRSATLWEATLNQPSPVTRQRKVNHSPTDTELKTFVGLVRIALLDANRRGVRITAEAKRILKWLEDGAPCAHDRAQKQQSTRNKKSSQA